MEIQSYTKKRIWPWIVLGIIVIIAAAFLIYCSDYYHSLPDDVSAMAEASEVCPLVQNDNSICAGSENAAVGIILLPGAKVEYTAYSPLVRLVAQNGYFCIVPKMPLNLAIFGVNCADDIIAQYPNIKSWYIGGHSLGGSMASEYAKNHKDNIAGLILLAAYTASENDPGMPVLLIHGSEDKVLKTDKFESAKAALKDYNEVVIDGGNHAYFANYGEQSGDGKASITPQQQWARTASEVCSFIAQNEAVPGKAA